MSTEINWENLYDLWRDLSQLKSQYPSVDTFVAGFDLKNRFRKKALYVPDAILQRIDNFIAALYESEEFTTPIPENPEPYESFEGARYRDNLLRIRYVLEDPPQKLHTLKDIIVEWIISFVASLPDFSEDGFEAGTVPAFNVVDVRDLAREFIRPLMQRPTGLFKELISQLESNFEPPNRKPLPAIPEFRGSMPELINSYFANTPFIDLFLTPLPLIVPEEIFIEQNKLPFDPDHPKHHCYQCRRPLPADFATKYWQQLSHPTGPFFDTERCKTTAANRHQSETVSSEDSLRSLAVEYGLYISRYEQEKRIKDTDQARKDKEVQERREDRDLKEWLRDQERQSDRDAREAERQAKEAERLRKEQEKADAEAAKLREFEEMTAPKLVSDAYRYEHTHVLGPQGSGKTTLLQQLVLDDLNKPDPPGYIIIDPKGFMVERIAHLDVFHPEKGRLRDRLVIINPAHKPALNMFKQRMSGFSADQQAAILNRLIDIFSYIFSSTDTKLTTRQQVPFGFIVRFVFWMGGDLHTLMEVLDDDNIKQRRFPEEMKSFAATDPTEVVGRFFEKDFYSTEVSNAKSQIKPRLYGILGRPELATMFLAPANNLDLLDCIQKRKIVLINTGHSYLDQDGSQLLGRYIIAMARNAAFARYFIPKDQWHPCYLMIDEFQDFADEDATPKLLRLVREYNMGVIMAHQQMFCNEFNESIRNSVSSAAIRYASSCQGQELNYMANQLNCEPDFLRAQVKYPPGNNPTHVRFACYVRGLTLQHPFSLSIPVKNLEHQPHMDDAAYDRLVTHSKQKLANRFSSETHKTPEGATTQAAEPMLSKDVSKPAQSEHSKEPDPSSAIGKLVTNQEQKSTPTANGEIEPHEPASNWKP